MRSIKLASLSMIIMLLFSVTSIFAQDDDTEPIKLPQDYALVNDFGTLLFSYPDEWGVVEWEVLEESEMWVAIISPNPEFIADPMRGLDSGELAGIISFNSINNTDDLSPDMSLEDISAHYLDGAFFEATITELTLGTNTVILAEQTDNRNEMRLYILRFGDIVVYADMRTFDGEITPFINTMDTLIASMDFTTDIMLSETITIEGAFSDTLSINYPAHWFASSESMGGDIRNIAESANYYDLADGQGLDIGEIIISLRILPYRDIPNDAIVEADSATEVLTLTVNELNNAIDSDGSYYDLGAIEALEINALEFAQSTGTYYYEGTIDQDTQFFIFLTDKNVVCILIIAGEDTLPTYQETIYEMINSIEYRAP